MLSVFQGLNCDHIISLCCGFAEKNIHIVKDFQCLWLVKRKSHCNLSKDTKPGPWEESRDKNHVLEDMLASWHFEWIKAMVVSGHVCGCGTDSSASVYHCLLVNWLALRVSGGHCLASCQGLCTVTVPCLRLSY